jgi:tRNA A58 N-methylase Trm61
MNKLSFALVGAATIALAACGGKGNDTLSENITDNYDAAADNLEAAAENVSNEADVLENQADALRNEGENKADAAAQTDANAAAVNAM